MPVVLSLIVLLVVLYCFWLFIRTATPYQMGRVLAVLAWSLGLGALGMLALTGRLPLALLILIVLWLLMTTVFGRQRKKLLLQHTPKSDLDGDKKDQINDDQKPHS